MSGIPERELFRGYGVDYDAPIIHEAIGVGTRNNCRGISTVRSNVGSGTMDRAWTRGFAPSSTMLAATVSASPRAVAALRLED